jgi:rhodanese-related sulfurtransferase
MAYDLDGINQIEENEMLEIYEKKQIETVLLDVREQDEYDAAHIPGVKLLPMSEIVEIFKQELEPDKSYVVICRSGNRSQKVCKFLQEQGFNNLTNYAGGMLEWTGDTE